MGGRECQSRVEVQGLGSKEKDEPFNFPRASSMSFFLAEAVRDICSSAEAMVMYSSSGSIIWTDSLIALLRYTRLTRSAGHMQHYAHIASVMSIVDILL